MRVLESGFLCLSVFLASAEFARAADYTVTPVPSDYGLRNNNGARVKVDRTFTVRSQQDWDLFSTTTVFDSNGGVVAERATPNHFDDTVRAFSDTNIVAGKYTWYPLVFWDGVYAPAVGNVHAYTFANGVFSDLHAALSTALSPPGTSSYESVATDVNNAGDVIGTFRTGSETAGFLYKKDGTVFNLGRVDWLWSGAINNFGQVAATDYLGRAFLYSQGSVTNLGSLSPTTDRSTAIDINDAGQITGTSQGHAFLYEGGKMIDMGSLGGPDTLPHSINKAGAVVGYSRLSDGTTRHGFIYRYQNLWDLNGLVDASSLNGATIVDATAIYDDGTILAQVQGPSGTSTVKLTPTIPPATDSAVFNFEMSPQGWESNGEPIIYVSRSPAEKFAGASSLGLRFSNTSGYASVRILNPSAQAGHTVTLHVYLPADAHVDWVQPFAQEDASGNWAWHGKWTSIDELQPGAWNTVTLEIPADAKPLYSIGFELYVSQPYTGTVYLDSIDYGSTADGAQYNFESNTQGWDSGDSSASVSKSSVRKFAGASSLGVTLNNSSFTSVKVPNPGAHAGQTVWFHVYLPADAPIDAIQPFAQEDASGSWAWHGNWTPSWALQLGAWNTIGVEVPADAQALDSIGMQIFTTAPYSGTVYIDSVSY